MAILPLILKTLSKIFRVNISVDYKKLELVEVIDKRNFKVCQPKEIRKGRIWQRAFVVHVKNNGHISWEEVG